MKRILNAVVFCMAASVLIHYTFLSFYADEKECLEESLRHCIARCYILEGKYPEDVACLKEKYSLAYDEDAFCVNYIYMGENIPPDYTVIGTGEPGR